MYFYKLRTHKKSDCIIKKPFIYRTWEFCRRKKTTVFFNSLPVYICICMYVYIYKPGNIVVISIISIKCIQEFLDSVTTTITKYALLKLRSTDGLLYCKLNNRFTRWVHDFQTKKTQAFQLDKERVCVKRGGGEIIDLKAARQSRAFFR